MPLHNIAKVCEHLDFSCTASSSCKEAYILICNLEAFLKYFPPPLPGFSSWSLDCRSHSPQENEARSLVGCWVAGMGTSEEFQQMGKCEPSGPHSRPNMPKSHLGNDLPRNPVLTLCPQMGCGEILGLLLGTKSVRAAHPNSPWRAS